VVEGAAADSAPETTVAVVTRGQLKNSREWLGAEIVRDQGLLNPKPESWQARRHHVLFAAAFHGRWKPRIKQAASCSGLWWLKLRAKALQLDCLKL
jgi:hypothetical protein